MGTKVGELFVELGVKGNDKTVGDTKKSKDAFEGLKATAIETKVAILAVFYGMERLVSTSGQLGSTLKNYVTITGMSAKTLQEYQYAARQANVSNESLMKSFENLQSKMFDIMAGKGAPQWFATITGALQRAGVDLTGESIKQWQQHPELAMRRLQQFATLPGIDNATKTGILSQFGIGTDVIAAMERGVFSQKNLAAAQPFILSDDTINRLDRLNIAWTNLTATIMKFFHELTAEHGGGLVGDISKVTHGILEVGRALDELANKMKIFKGLAFLASTMGKVLQGDATLIRALANMDSKMADKGLKQLTDAYLEFGKGVVGAGKAGGTSIIQHFHGHDPNSENGIKQAAKDGATVGIAQTYSSRAAK